MPRPCFQLAASSCGLLFAYSYASEEENKDLVQEEPGATTLDDVRVHRYLLKSFGALYSPSSLTCSHEVGQAIAKFWPGRLGLLLLTFTGKSEKIFI